MKKRNISSLFLALVLLAALTLSGSFTTRAEAAETASGSCGENVNWKLEGGVLTISGTGKMQDITATGELWYDYGNQITSVKIENGVTSIGKSAFSACPNLTSVTIPGSVTSIGKWAFYYCTNLTSVMIPDGVTSIGEQAFRNCYGITTVFIGKSIASIDMDAFSNCTGLSYVYYGGTSTQWDFVNIDAGNRYLTKANHFYFNAVTSGTCGSNLRWTLNGNFALSISGTGKMTDFTNGAPWDAFKEQITSVEFQNGVTSIGDRAFSGCSSLTGVTIPDSVTSIGLGGFQYCSSLTSVTIPDSVTSIGRGAFYICSSLTSITIPEGVTNIGNYTFYLCTSLTDVTIPNSVTSIEVYAFWNCTSLASVTIGNSITEIGRYAFGNCSVLGDVYYGGTQRQWNSITFGEGNDCLANGTIHYNFAPMAITTQPQNQSVNADTTAKFSVKATGSELKYQWQYRTSSSGSWKDSGAASATTATFSVKATTARNGYQYRCKITDSNGQIVYSNTVTLTVTGGTALTITTQPKTQNVKADATAKFTVKATGSGLKYQWQYRTSSSGSWKNSGATSATTATFSVKGTTARNGYQYRCKVTDSSGNSVYTNTVTLYVLGITTQPKTTTVANTATAKFTVKATGNALKYQWQYRTSSSGSWKDSGAASATTATFSVKGTTARNGYQYRCKITDSTGNTIYSSTVTLKVSAASITTQPKSVTVADGKTAKFTVKTSGSGLSYQWQYRTSSSGSWKDSGAASATTTSFSVKGTAARNGYQYRCKITDSNGNVIYTNVVTLTVK